MSAKKSPPTQIICYLCTRCQWDFVRAETDAAKCTLCGKKDKLTEINRGPVTPQALEQGMMRSMERLLTGLAGAYDAHQRGATDRDEKRNDEEEIFLLKAMVKAKNLQRYVEKAF